jgi:hypothetical protein
LLSYLVIVATRFENYFIFEQVQNTICANSHRIYRIELSSLSSQKYVFGIRDPVSGKNLFRIPDPEYRGQKVTGSRIRIRNTVFLSSVVVVDP